MDFVAYAAALATLLFGISSLLIAIGGLITLIPALGPAAALTTTALTVTSSNLVTATFLTGIVAVIASFIQQVEATLGVYLNGKLMSEQEALKKQEAADLNLMITLCGTLFASIAGIINDITIKFAKESAENINRQNKFEELLNEEYYWEHRGYDCSEIAEDFYKAANEQGIIYRIESKKGLLYFYEYKALEEFEYHEVYSDGVYIYDPRYKNVPVLKDDYFRLLNELNPQGLDIFTKK